jgi:hypothetical protein
MCDRIAEKVGGKTVAGSSESVREPQLALPRATASSIKRRRLIGISTPSLEVKTSLITVRYLDFLGSARPYFVGGTPCCRWHFLEISILPKRLSP